LFNEKSAGESVVMIVFYLLWWPQRYVFLLAITSVFKVTGNLVYTIYSHLKKTLAASWHNKHFAALIVTRIKGQKLIF